MNRSGVEQGVRERKEETGTATEQNVKLIKERSYCSTLTEGKRQRNKKEMMEVDREFRD